MRLIRDFLPRLIIACAALYVIVGVVCTLPMFGEMNRRMAAGRAARERFGDDPAKLAECLKDPDHRMRQVCAGMMAALGPKAAGHGPALLRMMVAEAAPARRYPEYLAEQALGKNPLGADAAREMLKDLDSADITTRWRGLYALELVGPAGVEFAPLVVPFTESATPELRGQAARTLGAMGRPAFDQGACSMVKMITDKDRFVQDGLTAALKSVNIEFGDWQNTIGRCRS